MPRSHKRALPVLIVCGLFLMMPQALFAYSVYLQSQVQVPAGPVRLGDLGRVEAGAESSAADAKQIAEKLLFRDLHAPRYVQAAELRRGLGNGPGKLERVYGAGTWVVPQGRVLDNQALEAMLLKEIDALSGGERDGSLVLRLAPNVKIPVPSEGVRLLYRLPSRAGALSPGRRIIPLDVVPEDVGESPSKNVVFARHQIQVTILKKRKIPVAARDLPVGHRLTKDDYRLEERELEHEDAQYASGDLSGRRVMSDVRSGTELTSSHVQLMPVIRRGQSLRLVYQRPGMVFRLRSVALRNGDPGDRIPVRVLYPSGRNSKTLTVTVIGEGTVVYDRKNQSDDHGEGR